MFKKCHVGARYFHVGIWSWGCVPDVDEIKSGVLEGGYRNAADLGDLRHVAPFPFTNVVSHGIHGVQVTLRNGDNE